VTRSIIEMRLQTQLTLSHLLVTVISIVILLLGLLLGYTLYLNSNWAAAWTADWAELYADEIDLMLFDECTECVTELVESEFIPVSDMPAFDEWIIVIDDDGTVLGSNDPARFAIGSDIFAQLPFGLDSADFEPDTTTYGNIDSRHFALSAMPTQGGWVYFHGGSSDNAFQLQQAARSVLLVSLALGLIALLVSGLMGGWLGRFFGRKLDDLGTTSAAFAAGDLTRRVHVTGDDEIAQLGHQFNQMADTIARQIGELHDLAEANAQLAEEAEGLARLEERNRLARDLHDAVKQQLFGLNLTLASIPPLLDSKPEIARQRIAQIGVLSQAIQVELDQIIKQLRPVSLQDQGLASALRQLVTQWSNQTGVSAEIDVQQARSLPLTIEQAAFRITQEAVQNIGRHANATHVTVTLIYAIGELQLSVSDNGTGFDVTQVDDTHSFGLANMRQRAETVGGSFAIDSDNDGTRIDVRLPIAEETS
jgi:NarL family two-component system sensor histidine kinase LiaS